METVFRVQAESGVQALAVLTFPYTSTTENMIVEYVRVRKPDGNVISTPEYNIQDMPAEVTRSAPMYSDIHEKHIVVKGLDVGDLLEYAIRTQIIKAEVPDEFWFQYAFEKKLVVKSEELDISVPLNKLVSVYSPEVAPQATVEGDRRVYRWKTQNLIPPDPQEEPLRESPPPSVEVATFQDWQQVGNWYWRLQRSQIAVTPAIKAKVLELLKGLTSDEAKVQALYNFVSYHIHYVSLSFGIGRYQPHLAEDVLENGYGDCKDKHTLLAAMLMAAGYRSWPALVNTTTRLVSQVPSPGQFDHVVTVVPHGNSLWWMDTTVGVAPFGLLLTNIRDKEVLVIPDDGEASLMKTPAEPPFESLQTFDADGTLSPDGTFSGHITRSARGDVEVLFRLGFRATVPAQWTQLAQLMSYSSGFAGKVENVKTSELEDTSTPFQISYDYTRKDYGDWPNNITPPLPPFGIEASSEDEKKPREPLLLGALGQVVYKARVQMPTGYSLIPPLNLDLVTGYAEYHARYSFMHGTLMTERRFVIKHDTVPLAEWKSYLEFRKAVANDEKNWIRVLSPHDNHTVSASHLSQGTEALKSSGWAALRARNYLEASELFKKALEIDPSDAQAWSNLGFAYMALNRLDDAAAAFRKEISISPVDQSAHNNLGRVLQDQGKFDDAAIEYRRAIDIYPQNPLAHVNLGILLRIQKKLPESLQELKTAASISDTAQIEMNLGQVYLGLNDRDKALVAFDRSVALEPSPANFNDIAYVLAEHNEYLDKAEQYAESAVSSLEAMLRDVQLDTVQNRQIFNVDLLGMSWDTLGWVYFRQGKFQDAEEYLLAGWNLNQHPEEANHLGQVYEKQGRIKEAEKLYAQAASFSDAPANARQRLIALTGSPELADAEASRMAGELSKMRTVQFKGNAGARGTAEFLISFGRGVKVEEVKFISGDKELAEVIPSIAGANYSNVVFPSNDRTKLIRRGILTCTEDDVCRFVLMLPNDVHSVN